MSLLLLFGGVPDQISIERKTDVGGSYAEIHVSDWTDSSWTDTGPFTAGHTYYYRSRKLSGGVYSDYSNEVSVDIGTPKTCTIDGRVKEVLTKTCTLDGIVKEINTKTCTIAGIVKEVLPKTCTIDGIIKEINPETITLDGIVKAINLETITIDSFIKEILPKTVTLDGLIQSGATSLRFWTNFCRPDCLQSGRHYFNKVSGQATRRHPDGPTYCCFLSDLTGLAGFCRAGPARTRPVAYRRRELLSMNPALLKW